MKATANVSSGAVNYQNDHILYVEGDEHSIDTEVLKTLLGNILWIQPLGSSLSISSVAESLYPTHPNSYFLIDRDYHLSDECIEAYWQNFPDPQTHNLLVWRRKELENDFLEPSFLVGSSYCKEEFKENNGQRLQAKVISLAQERLYLDAANYVIVSLREDFKRKWVENFSNPSEFPNEESALDRLTEMSEFKAFSARVSQLTAEQEIARRFRQFLNQMTGGTESLQWGSGAWLNMISGKSIFRSLVAHCFWVFALDGTRLQSKEAINCVAKDLVRAGKKLPDDLLELKSLIETRVGIQ